MLREPKLKLRPDSIKPNKMLSQQVPRFAVIESRSSRRTLAGYLRSSAWTLLATDGRCRYGCGRLRWHQTGEGTWRRWGLDTLHNHQGCGPRGAPVYGAPV